MQKEKQDFIIAILACRDMLLHSANLIADFWYTCWVDAGKPDLSAITLGWSAEAQTKWEAELKLLRIISYWKTSSYYPERQKPKKRIK